MTDEATEDEAAETAGSAPRMVPAGALVLAIMVAAALGVLAVVALTVRAGGDDGSRDEARSAAGRFAERFLSFDHDHLDEWKADVLALSTGGFSSEVDDVEDGLRELVDQAELDATAQVTDIFMGDVDRGAVSAVLVYDRDLTGKSGGRSETDRYLQLSLLSVDGEWLVDNVIDIASAQVPTASSTTTTTSARGSSTSEPTPSTVPGG